MSAKNAADALIAFDTEIAERYHALVSQGWTAGHEKWTDFVHHIRGCWTLGMVAKAAGVTEQQVAAALLTNKYGSSIASRGLVAVAFA